MLKIWEFFLYALSCAGNVLLAIAGKSEFTDNWITEGLIGIVTILIIVLLFRWLFIITGLLRIEKRK